MLTQRYFDGIQPYVHYKRLLSLANLIKSLTDNPILPSDIFLNRKNQTLSLQPGENGYGSNGDKLENGIQIELMQ
jgi:hypothetical protein